MTGDKALDHCAHAGDRGSPDEQGEAADDGILGLVLIRSGGGDWREPEQRAYLNEPELQALLAASPEFIPGVDESLAVVREFPVDTGSIDLVGVSPAGDVVVCECKLERNEEARRKVVGQILSYAGALWGMPYEDFARSFDLRSERPLAEAVSQHALVNDWTEETWRQRLVARLERGAFQLVVVVEAISEELKRTITLLNAKTTESFSLVALELRYQRDGDIELLIPETYGTESRDTRPGSQRRTRWDEPQFLAALEASCSTSELDPATRLYEGLREVAAQVSFGTGGSPSASFAFNAASPPTSFFSLYTGADGSNFAVNFGFVHDRARPAVLEELLDRVRRLPGAGDRFDRIPERGFRLRPGIPGNELFAVSGAVEQILDTARWLADQDPPNVATG